MDHLRRALTAILAFLSGSCIQVIDDGYPRKDGFSGIGEALDCRLAFEVEDKFEMTCHARGDVRLLRLVAEFTKSFGNQVDRTLEFEVLFAGERLMRKGEAVSFRGFSRPRERAPWRRKATRIVISGYWDEKLDDGTWRADEGRCDWGY